MYKRRKAKYDEEEGGGGDDDDIPMKENPIIIDIVVVIDRIKNHPRYDDMDFFLKTLFEECIENHVKLSKHNIDFVVNVWNHIECGAKMEIMYKM